jgi:cytochrome c peroxidase
VKTEQWSVLISMLNAVTRLYWPLFFVACSKNAPDSGDASFEFSTTEMALLGRHQFDISPPPDTSNAVADNEAAAKLGQYLFFDTGLSSNGEVNCATCHQPEHGFSDPEVLSTAIGTTQRHSPTIVNTAYNRWFYWDGRCDTLWCQATGPLEAPYEQGTNRLAVAHHLFSDSDLSAAYTTIFGPFPDLSDTDRFPANARPVTDDEEDPSHIAWTSMNAADQVAATTVFVNAAKAIAAFERTLIQRNSDFDEMLDAFVDGDSSGGATLTDSAKRGATMFVGDGMCWACHAGPTFTNMEFHNVALPEVAEIDNQSTGRYDGIAALLANPFNSMGQYSDDDSDADLKLTHLVHSLEEVGTFKTPGLRNLMDTAPYMHGGHFESLTGVVRHYNEMDDPPPIGHREELLLPRGWSDAEVADLVAFLESLQGQPIDESLLNQPVSPL